MPGKISDARICEAVRNRRVVRCVYAKGEARTIEPHCHGHSHSGKEVLSVFQVPQGWKLFETARIVSFQITDDVFDVRSDFSPENPGITQVHCCVAP